MNNALDFNEQYSHTLYQISEYGMYNDGLGKKKLFSFSIYRKGKTQKNVITTCHISCAENFQATILIKIFVMAPARLPYMK